LLDEYILHLEKELLTGKARWVADFTESFRNRQIGDTFFDMLVTGKTRPKGLFLSRIFAFFFTPNYKVACLVRSVTDGMSLDRLRLAGILRTVEKFMKRNEIDWSWVIIAKEGGFPETLKNFVQTYRVREVGVALVDVSSGDMTTSSSFIGKNLERYAKAPKAK
jgi:hypothetical protein